MKTIKIISLSAAIICASGTTFGGSADKVVETAIDAGGYLNSAADTGAKVTGNEALKNVDDKTKPLALISNVADVGATAVTETTLATSSGPVIMETLSAASMVGGVVGGAATISGVGGLATASLMNEHVFNGDTKADEAARVATYTGAIVATAGTAGTVATVGAGPAGLAAIGASVGGGMAAGAITVVLAPVAVAVIAGAGAYYFSSWLLEE